MKQTKHNRTINRQKLTRPQLEAELKEGVRQAVFAGYSALLKARKSTPAFHPNAEQTVLDCHPAVFAVERRMGVETAVCLHNVSNQTVKINLPTTGKNMLTGEELPQTVKLNGYESVWIEAE